MLCNGYYFIAFHLPIVFQLWKCSIFMTFCRLYRFTVLDVNQMSQDDQRSGWFSGLFASKNHFRALPSFAKEPVASSSSLQPGELIGVGCNSAVWAAAVAADSDDDSTSYMYV